MLVSSSSRCTPSSGQSYQAAVLWRGTSPKDAHVSGKGERKLNFFFIYWDEEDSNEAVNSLVSINVIPLT